MFRKKKPNGHPAARARRGRRGSRGNQLNAFGARKTISLFGDAGDFHYAKQGKNREKKKGTDTRSEQLSSLKGHSAITQQP